MDVLYWACAGIASSALVVIALIIPYGVYTRYVMHNAASWPEPSSLLLSIVLTFFGAAACYRAGVHMRVTVARDPLPQPARRVVELISELLVGALAIFMIVWGSGLCATTWHQHIDAIATLSVGLTYLPIPLGGLATALFVIERLLIGPPAREPWEYSSSS
jgi:TRAP-type C4-dicarboxylate transport system permease small subunit